MHIIRKNIALIALCIWTLNCLHIIQYYPANMLVQWHGDQAAHAELSAQTNMVLLWRHWILLVIIILLGIISSIASIRDYNYSSLYLLLMSLLFLVYWITDIYKHPYDDSELLTSFVFKYRIDWHVLNNMNSTINYIYFINFMLIQPVFHLINIVLQIGLLTKKRGKQGTDHVFQDEDDA